VTTIDMTVALLLFMLGLALGGVAAFAALRRRPAAARRAGTGAGTRSTHPILEAMARAAGASTETAQLDAGLDMLVEALHPAVEGATQLVAAVLLVEGEGWRVAAARRMEPADRQRRIFAPPASLLARAVADRQTQVAPLPFDDPCLEALTSLGGCASAICVPLLADDRVTGLLLAAHPQARFFEGARLAVTESAAYALAAVHAQSRRLLDVVRDRERLTEIQEEWRKRLSRDLHDGPTQAIAAIAMQLNYAGRLLERNPAAAQEELRKSEELARRTTREVRNTLFTLRPLLLESQGLVAAIAQLAEKEREAHRQLVLVEAEPDVARGLDPDTQGIIFYLAEEAIHNARKHAQAEHTWVRLTRPSGRLLLEIEDDGVGFNVGSVDANYAQRGSLGMVTMRERAELVGGTLQVDSAEGRGTRVRVLIPLPERTPADDSTAVPGTA
jgi:signal transduction histidine kinase